LVQGLAHPHAYRRARELLFDAQRLAKDPGNLAGGSWECLGCSAYT
jgi:hypothetical protein